MRRTCTEDQVVGHRQQRTDTQQMSRYLGLHVHEVQPLCVNPHVDPDDFVVTGTGLRVDLACEESCSVGWDVPAVLQEESLQVVHLFAHTFAGAQGLVEKGLGVEAQVTHSSSGTLCKGLQKL